MTILPTTIIEFDIAHHAIKELTIDELDPAIQDDQKIYWIHCDLTHHKQLKILSKKLHLPDYLMQLCLHEDTLPKLVDDGESIAIQLECLLSNELTPKQEANFGNLIFYLTSRFCFTATSSPIPALKTFVENHPKAVKYAKTPCFILFLILDDAINDFSKLLLDYELIADKMDLLIYQNRKNMYNDVMTIKKQIMKIQHHIASIRDLLMRTSGRKISVISEQCRLSLINLLEHTQIIFSEAEAIRESLRNILDQIENALMQKMNNTMKVLTAFAAIFLPLSLIAGIYGMNFVSMPELHWKYGYFWALGLMLVCAICLFLFFRKMKWF